MLYLKSLTLSAPLHLISTSTCIRRLFFSGYAEGRIEKNAQQIFFKGEKAAPVQVRCPPAVEAKAKSYNNIEKKQKAKPAIIKELT